MHLLATRRSTLRQLPAWILYTAFALLAILVLWSCHLGPEDGKDTFDVVGEDAWTECDEVVVVLLDGDGKAVDTLFRGALESLDQLKKLDAGRYEGGKGVVHIRGTKDGGLCFEQKRSFDSPRGSVKVDTLSDPKVSPVSLEVAPESLVISMGSPAADLSAFPVPAYADGNMIWSLDNSGVVALEGLSSGRGNPARVKPLKAGAGVLMVRSAKDTSVSRRVKVRVVSITLGGIEIGTVNDTVRLYERGPAESLKVEVPAEYRDQRIEWRSANKSVAEVDAAGRIRPVKAGQTHVQATLIPSGLSDVAVVQVKLDTPVLTVESRKGAPVGVDIVFSARAVQEFGTLKVFKWDLDGDGGWDDSSDVTDTGRAVHLPAKQARYDKEGPVTAGFLVRDSEGNEAKTEVLLDIGNQAPEIADLRSDTVISVKDEIPMGALVRDHDGKVAWVGWDYEGDGRFDDTLAVSDSVVRFSRRHRFVEAGTYNAVLRAVDGNGKARQDTARVKVEFDAPVADAGPDFTVGAGEPVTLSAKGTDKFGLIARRAIRCRSDTAFTYISVRDTTFPAPRQPGVLKCAVRVTDDDGLSGEDEVEVTVVLSSNADLIELQLSAGVLAPSFRSNTPEYEGRLAFTDSVVTVTPKAKDGSAEILVNGKQVASGSASPSLKLPVRRTADAFVILVTAADGSQRKYAVHLTRDPNGEATLARLEAPGLALSPAFAPGTVDYSDTVRFDVSTATFKATVASAGATLSFGDSAMTSGTFTAPQALKFGENVFRFTVTAMDGESRTTYTVKVFRLGRLITFRKLGGASSMAQDTFDMAVGASRPVSVAGASAYSFSRWTLLEGKASLADSGANPTTLKLESGLARVQADFNPAFRMTGAVAEGKGTISPVDSLVDSGAVVTWRFRPAAGYRILDIKSTFKAARPWTSDSVSANNSPEGGARGDQHVDVLFRRQFALTVNVGRGGTVNQASRPVDSGSTLAFTATPDIGYRVDSVLVNGTMVSTSGLSSGAGSISPQNWSMGPLDGPSVVRVTFRRVFTIEVKVGENGTVTPGRTTYVDSGASQTFTIAPTTGFHLAALAYDGVDVAAQVSGGVFTVANVQKNAGLAATFAINTYTLTIIGTDVHISSPGGKWFPLGTRTSVTMNYGDILGIRTAANNLRGQVFAYWSLGGPAGPLYENPAVIYAVDNITYTAVYRDPILSPVRVAP